MIFPSGSVVPVSSNSWQKIPWWTKATLPKFLTDRCGC